MRSYTQVT